MSRTHAASAGIACQSDMLNPKYTAFTFMMKLTFRRICQATATSALISLTMAIAVVGAEPRPLKKKDIEELAEDLENLRKAVVAQQSKKNGAALKAFTKHVSSPVAANAFYLECLKKLRFTDENKRSEAWRTYKEDNNAELSAVYHRAAKQLELSYIILSIKAARAKDRRDVVPEILAHIDRLLNLDGRAFEFIDTADQSIFSETYDIQETVNPGHWEMDPTNISGIYEMAILEHMRAHRDPRLVSAWKNRIDHMTRYAEKRKEGEIKTQREEEREERRGGGRGGRRGWGGDPRLRAEARAERDDYETFMTETLPELKWEMCTDLIEYGFRDEALPLMIRVIKEHRDSGNVLTWLGELDTELQKALKEFDTPAAGSTGSS